MTYERNTTLLFKNRHLGPNLLHYAIISYVAKIFSDPS